MSTYQYYEFQAIDQALTVEEQRAVAELSSRVDPHPRQPVFVYNWSGFPGNAGDILARYYDAMLYLANWGSRRLAFRFPKRVLDLEGVRAYRQPLIVEDYLSLRTAGEYVVLDMAFHNEEGHDWVEGGGWLPAMVSLRDDILRGDYRALYLVWLKVVEVEDLLDSVREPPVPPGLKQLSPALCRLVQFFAIDGALVQVAAEGSGTHRAVPDEWLQEALARLPGEERDAFLLRLAQGEPHLSVALKRRLREVSPGPEPEPGPRRTVGNLLAESKARDMAR